MTVEERELALFIALKDGLGSAERLSDEIAAEMHYRPQTVKGWNTEKLSSVGSKIHIRDAQLIIDALRSLHLQNRTAMLCAFLDELGVAHKNGVTATEVFTNESAYVRFSTAADSIWEKFPHDHVCLYLLFMGHVDPPGRPLIERWFLSLADGLKPDASEAAPERVDIERLSELAATPTETAGFTTLDHRLIYAIVDCAAEVDGAPTEDELDDLINEILHLNGRRHRTYFHVGYADALLDRPLQSDLPADNEARRAWYWAGVISGLGRAADYDEILRLYGSEPSVRNLGKSPHVPAETTAPIIVNALFAAGREAECAPFLSFDALSQSPQLRIHVLSLARQSIRRNRATECKAILELLYKHLEVLHAPDEEDAAVFEEVYATDLKRRLALCYRQLGERSRAEQILTQLAKHADGITRANALTDLGLIKAGKRRLGDLRIPDSEDHRAQLLAQLSEGEQCFREALRSPDHVPAHASFAVGVLCLLRDDVENAVTHLENAYGYFASQPEVYSFDKSLQLCGLYLGLSECLCLRDSPAIGHAYDLLKMGLDAGEHIPGYLIPTTLTALSLTGGTLTIPTAELILKSGGDSALDALLLTPETHTSKPLASALLERTLRKNRSEIDRAKDARLALRLFLMQERFEEAERALDVLEDLANEGVEREAFLDLLGEPAAPLSAVWDRDDIFWARIECLESAGVYSAASQLLAEEFHRVLRRVESYALVGAEEILDRIRSYGTSFSELVRDLGLRFDAEKNARTETAPPVQSSFDPRLRILVVGGAEPEQRHDERIAEELLPMGIEVRFLHSGWSGNQSANIDEFKRLLPSVDGCVIMRLVRTNYGRTVRRLCTKPWWSCGGKGRGSVINSILTAAHLVTKEQAAIIHGA